MAPDGRNEQEDRPDDQGGGATSSHRDLAAFAQTLAEVDRIEGDRHVVALATAVRRLDTNLRDLLSTDNRDTDEIPGFAGAADRLAASVTDLCANHASSIAGLLAKAEIAVNFHDFEGERAGRVALSLASDLQILGAAR